MPYKKAKKTQAKKRKLGMKKGKSSMKPKGRKKMKY